MNFKKSFNTEIEIFVIIQASWFYLAIHDVNGCSMYTKGSLSSQGIWSLKCYALSKCSSAMDEWNMEQTYLYYINSTKRHVKTFMPYINKFFQNVFGNKTKNSNGAVRTPTLYMSLISASRRLIWPSLCYIQILILILYICTTEVPRESHQKAIQLSWIKLYTTMVHQQGWDYKDYRILRKF